MKNRIRNNIKLGLFVISGIAFLMVMLFMIGKDTNMFSKNFTLKARFYNVSGLMPGNNVRFSGIQVGTVKDIDIINDTTVEVLMIIDEDIKQFISRNATVAIGSEGLMGNKIVNIIPGKGVSEKVEDGDILASKKSPDTDEMLRVLYETNNTVAGIAANLKTTIDQINNSSTLWSLLNDQSISSDFKVSLANIRTATSEVPGMLEDFHAVINEIQNGEGAAGLLLNDSMFSADLLKTVESIHVLSEQSQKMVTDLNRAITQINYDVNEGSGTANAILKDSAMANSLNTSIENIEKASAAFNENMEALKHNFLFRKYFKKQEKEQQERDAGN